MKIWMSQNTRTIKNYAARHLLPLFGSIALVIIIMFIGIYLADLFNLSMESVSCILCIGLTAFIVGIAFRIGKSYGRDSLIFCQDDMHNLFVINVMSFVNYRRGTLGFVSMTSQAQYILERLKKEKFLEYHMQQPESLTKFGPQILNVEKIKPNRKGYAVRCLVRHPSGNTQKCTYLILPGYERERELLMALKMKKSVGSMT